MDTKNQSDKRSVIRSAYFYLASFVTLGIVVGSSIFLANLAFKEWVFTNAEPTSYQYGPPPSIFFSSTPSEIKTIGQPAGLSCEEECVLTDNQKNGIDEWKSNYESWKAQASNPGVQRTRDAVNGLSFLIIALPVFIIHYRIAQRDEKKQPQKEQGVIRPTYYYLASFSALLMVVIAGGILVNLMLKTWVFPSASEADNQRDRYRIPVSERMMEEAPVQSIVDCGSACGLDDDTVALAQTWIQDYKTWEEQNKDYSSIQRDAASALPFVFAGIPIFWYHWTIVRRESREKKEGNTPEQNDSSAE